MASRWLRVSALLEKYRTPLLITSCSGLFGLNLVQHLVPDQLFCSVYQAWFRGEPVQLSERLEKLFQQVLSDVSVRFPQRFSAFASFGFHPVGAGLPILPSGARIGIPANFNSCESECESGITNRTIFVNGRMVDWSSASGHALSSALMMSESAQRFALAREVARLNSCFPALSAAVGPLCVGGVWVFSVTIKHINRHRSSSLPYRAFLNLVSLALGGAFYFMASDAVAHFADQSADKQAAAVAPGYAQGGVEFYEKILSRNRTLRELMGPEGQKMYSASGNLFPANILQLRNTPYTVRRDRLKAMIQD